MVSVIVTSQGSIALVRSGPHWSGPFEVGEVPNEGQESVIGDVEGSKLGRIFLLLGLSIGAFLALALIAFLPGRALICGLVTLGGYHNCL